MWIRDDLEGQGKEVEETYIIQPSRPSFGGVFGTICQSSNPQHYSLQLLQCTGIGFLIAPRPHFSSTCSAKSESIHQPNNGCGRTEAWLPGKH
jgi:hypothetical protein